VEAVEECVEEVVDEEKKREDITLPLYISSHLVVLKPLRTLCTLAASFS
jgi:hypothetical protein